MFRIVVLLEYNLLLVRVSVLEASEEGLVHDLGELNCREVAFDAMKSPDSVP